MHFDVFNGDADGVIALLQLRLAEPKASTLVTGVKRDIALLKRVDAKAGDSVTVLDVSMEKNIAPLEQILAAGATVAYFDHHRPGDIPQHDGLQATIDMDPNTCTALLVDAYLGGQYRLWAITAAYGDNMIATADRLAEEAGLTEEQSLLLKEFGILLNYNGYGAEVSDLHYAPDALFQALLAYENPFDAIADSDSPYHRLKAAYEADMAQAEASEILASDAQSAVYFLGAEAWCRRVSGVFGNELANRSPERAHAVLTLNDDGSYLVSVRAPLNNKDGADEVCSAFPTGGGRKGAAGINQLPAEMLESFIHILSKRYQ
ncbi:DHH family phosphoesterase [Ferrimonas balearica]|uniref:DHH family phosphoesterase n=1 Tax=Ferrimonas balearica TaxID=44012 RepID=UPI001C99E218|nr:DHH family phosphoesterase [Ferrimonas balearica]MBY5921243.1 DHH family phosphoesterase [Ferrimonas balearica]MBY5996072.1 DHH family phosphoesterase [Ferrimonas balearica]